MDISSEHLALILFVYGLAFFGMGLAIMLQARPESRLALARHLWPLALFGFLHAGVEWLDMVSVARLHNGLLAGLVPLVVVRMGLLVASTMALFWFGAALLAEAGGRWRYCLAAPPLMLLVWACVMVVGTIHSGWHGDGTTAWVSTWTRYLLYFPASLLSGLALAHQAPALHGLGMAGIASDCRRAAYVFGANAVVAGLVVPAADFFPASIINYQTFQEAIGLPPHLFRAAAALAIAYFVVRVLRLFDLQVCLERQWFASQALLAQEEERKRISRELHDETAQLLSSLLVRLTLMDQAKSLEDVRNARLELTSLASRAEESVRRLAVELRPPELDDLGLVEALRWYVDDFGPRWGVNARLQVTGPVARLTSTTEMALYRIAQESLTNAAKHARARQVTVSLEQQKNGLSLSVEDDGCGFDVAASVRSKDRGIGLFGIQERVTLLGGRLRLDSGLGRGTRVFVEIPVSAEGY